MDFVLSEKQKMLQSFGQRFYAERGGTPLAGNGAETTRSG